jgi:uncharacterized protein
MTRDDASMALTYISCLCYEHVTVLGWTKVTARETQKTFESEWVHVSTVRDGKITRWRGFANTAARYGF